MKVLLLFLKRFGWVVAILLLWLVVAFGMRLRVTDGDAFPIYQNDDGLFYTWAGLSMLENFWQPTSLTIFEKDNPHLIWRSQSLPFEPAQEFGFRIARPWFDQPPLGVLIISLPAYFLGYRGFEQIPQMVVRTSAFLAAFASLVLTYLLGKELFGKAAGWWGLTVLAVWPLAVFSQRQSYLENILMPLMLAGLLGVSKVLRFSGNSHIARSASFDKTQDRQDDKASLKSLDALSNRRRWLVVLVSVAVAGWIKLPGYFFVAMVGFWLLQAKDWHRLRQVVVVGVASFGLYLLYGQIVGGDYFWWTLLQQGGRGAYVSSWFRIFTSPDVFGTLQDGWWFLGWIALFFLAGEREKPQRFLVLNALFWMIVVFLTSGPFNTSPWYRYPLYPLLAMALGAVLSRVFSGLLANVRAPMFRLLWAGLLFLLGLTGWELAGVTVPSTWLRLGVLAVVGLFGLSFISRSKLLFRLQLIIFSVLLGIMVWGNVRAVYEYPKIRCGTGCMKPTKMEIHTN